MQSHSATHTHSACARSAKTHHPHTSRAHLPLFSKPPSPPPHSLVSQNYVHEGEIWRQRLKNETESAEVWKDNWGFLAGRGETEARGFSTSVAKYATSGGKWSVKTVRVEDPSAEGVAAAESEQNARKLMSSLTSKTAPAGPVKQCTHEVCYNGFASSGHECGQDTNGSSGILAQFSG